MLIYSSDFYDRAILSLHTGTSIAQIQSLVINPYNLTIIAFKLAGSRLDNPNDSFLLLSSVREISPIGFIVNSSDEIVASEDVIKLKEILDLNFKLPGIKVITKKGVKLGKVSDFVVNLASMSIEQLIIERPIFKAFLDPELTIHRSKIIDISNDLITIEDEKERPKVKQMVGDKVEPVGDFINPFRKEPKPEVNSSSQAE